MQLCQVFLFHCIHVVPWEFQGILICDALVLFSLLGLIYFNVINWKIGASSAVEMGYISLCVLPVSMHIKPSFSGSCTIKSVIPHPQK